MMKRLSSKLNSRRGFSLTELLAAILILSMVSSVVAGGIPVAKDAYEKITLSANAQVLLSTAISALRNQLCTASEVEIKDDGATVEYYSSTIQNYCKITKDSNDVKVFLYSKNKSGEGSAGPQERMLVSESAGDKKLHVTYSSVDFKTNGGVKDKRVIEFKGLRVVNADGTTRVELEGGNNSVVEIRLTTG